MKDLQNIEENTKYEVRSTKSEVRSTNQPMGSFLSSGPLRILFLTMACMAFTVTAGAEVLSDSLPSPFTTAVRNAKAAFMCDVCGCSGNGGSMGYGTGLDKNFAGMRYISQRYRSRDGIFNDSPWVNENFNTIQAWGRVPIGERVVVHAMIPYHFHHRTFADQSGQDLNNMGDMTLLGFYRLVKPSDSIGGTKFRHTLHVGGGIKLPTGKFDRANNEGSVNPSFQAGTGSWDYILAVDYGITLQNWGAGAMINYTFKTENSDHYHFGDQLNYGVHIYRSFALSDNFGLTPLAGISGEIFGENEQYGQPVANTEGDVFFGKWGLEAAYKKWSLGVTTMLPIAQNLNSGKVEVKNRFSVYVNFNI